MNARASKRAHRAVPEQDRHGESFATTEQVLLCCFGLDQDVSTTRSGKQLRVALTGAGFRPAAARHLVRDSGLLRATADGHYVLRPCDVAPAGR